MAALLLALASTIIIVFDNKYWIASRFLIGLFRGLRFPLLITNLSESLPEDSKDLILSFMFVSLRLGYIVIVYCIGLIMPNFEVENYRSALLMGGIPAVVSFFALLFTFNSSIKLMFHKSMYEEGIRSIKSISPESSEDDLYLLVESYKAENDSQVEETHLPYLLLFQKEYLCKTVSMLIICKTATVINVASIYALPLMLFDKGGHNNNHIVRDIIIIQLSAITAILVSTLLSKLFGKKVLICLGFLLSFVISSIPPVYGIGLVVCCALVNFFGVFPFFLNKISIVDMYPIHLRDLGLSFGLGVAKLADAVTPFICDFSLGFIIMDPLFC
jgi:Na+/melibiose symporter-like transporter